MNASRRGPPPLAASRRGTADGVAQAIKDESELDNGLGPVGGNLAGLLDAAERDEGRHKTLMTFPPHWREFIRRQDIGRLAAADALIDDHLERQAMRKFWIRISRIAIVVGPIVFAWAQGFFDKVLPFLQKIAKLVGTPPT